MKRHWVNCEKMPLKLISHDQVENKLMGFKISNQTNKGHLVVY